MQEVVPFLVILACPIGMGVMMFLMAKGMRIGSSKEPEPSRRTLDELRAEQTRLSAQIEQLDGRDELAARRD